MNQKAIDLIRKLRISREDFPIDGEDEIFCPFCNAGLNYENHESDCAWVEAGRFLENEKD